MIVRWLCHCFQPPLPKEAAVNKTLGVVLVVLGLFGIAWGGLRTQPGKRSSTSDRFTLHAKRHTTFRCLPSRARCPSLAVLCSS